MLIMSSTNYYAMQYNALPLTDIALLELSGDVTLHKGGLADAAIANQDKLELRNTRLK
jgi:hypothetical protein